MSQGRLKWVEACERAGGIVASGREMADLYRRALQYYGEGELRAGIQSLAFEAIEDEDLREEIFTSEEAMVSLFCGVWIQFLLTEIAGFKGEDLRTLALRAFKDFQGRQVLH